MLKNINEDKEFDAVRHSIQKQDIEVPQNAKKVKNFKCSGIGHTPRQCPAYSRKCGVWKTQAFQADM